MDTNQQRDRMKLAGLLLAGILICSAMPVYARDILVVGLFKDMVIFKLDNAQYKLRVGEAGPHGIRLISSTSEQAVLDVDGVRHSYTLGIPQSTRSYDHDKTFSEAKIWADEGMYLTVGSINGFPVSFLVDTGATAVAMNTAQAKRLGINYRYTGTRSAATTASGVVNTWLVKLKSVKVGDIELHDIDGAVIEGGGPSTILLGMSFLKYVKMQREGNLLQLQQKY